MTQPKTEEAKLLGAVKLLINAFVRALDEEMDRYIRHADDKVQAGLKWRDSRAGQWHERFEKILERLNEY